MNIKPDLATIGKQCIDSMIVILTTVTSIVLARVVTYLLRLPVDSTGCYLVEFALIVVPSVLVVTVASSYCLYIGALMILLAFLLLPKSRPTSDVGSTPTTIQLGNRSLSVTVLRALIQLVTAVCILAVDFKCFPESFRKSESYGATLMDVGIGLFVMAMGVVSRRVESIAYLRHSLLRVAMPLILLGITRVVALLVVNYHQVEHEYGTHLNAFFTLGLTKLFGTLVTCLSRTDKQLLFLGTFILVSHQLALTYAGISDYIMNESLPRSNIWSANREGIHSLPGFVALYLLAICLGKWLFSKKEVAYDVFIRKLRMLLYMSLISWTLMAACAHWLGVSRVACDLGYVVWMLAVSVTILGLTLLIFDLKLNRILPVTTKSISKSRDISEVFVICQSLNLNGLTFFLLSNVLTGYVNLSWNPGRQSDVTSVLILLIYMLLATNFARNLHRYHIRLA